MGKIKKTQLYKNGKNNNISFLTSKNKYSINKKNKRTRNYMNIRTLDALKQYGYGYIGKNQDGGFFIDYIKLKYKLHQFKKFITKFRKEEINIKKYIDSYEGKTTTFKQLADDKASAVTLYIISYRKKAIYEFMFQNIDTEKQFKTSNLEHDISLIDSRILGANESIKSFEKSVKKEIPKFKKYNDALTKDSKHFLKLVKFFESKLRKYYVTITQIKKDYNLYHDKKHIDEEAKKKIKKYKKFGADIETILKFKDTDVQNMNAIQSNLNTILDTGKDYVEKFKQLAKENYNEELDKWKENYSSIYENFTPINENINNIIEIMKEMKNNLDGILMQAQSIYVAGSSKDKELYLTTKAVIANCERFIQLLNLFDGSVNKLKIVILNETPFDKIEIDLLYIEGGFKDIQNKLAEYSLRLKDDKANIETELNKPKTVGGGSIIKQKKIKKMNNMKGGALSGNVTYKNFFEQDYNDFQGDLIQELIYFRTNISDDTIKKESTYKRILTLFNIFLFSIYYKYIRSDDCKDTTKTLDNSQNYNTEKDILLSFLKIIAIYNVAEKVYGKNTDYKFNATTIAFIRDLIINFFITKLDKYISIDILNQMTSYGLTGIKLKDLVCENTTVAYQKKYDPSLKASSNVDNFSKFIISAVEDTAQYKINNIYDIFTNIDRITQYTFVKYFDNADKKNFKDNIYENVYNNFLNASFLDKKADLKTSDPIENLALQLVELLNLPDPIPTTIKDVLSKNPVPVTVPVPVPVPVSSSTSSSTSSATSYLSVAPTSVMLTPFLINIAKLKVSDDIKPNLSNIKNYIINIIGIIDDKLRANLFENITKNINKINENVNNLKIIEPKLINVKIDAYDKVILKYDWLKDTYKMSDEPRIEITETKEIAQLLHEINPTSKLTSPTGELSKDEIMQLILKFNFPNPTNFSKDSFNKLKDKKNAELFLNVLDKEYPDSRDKSKACAILYNIKQQDPVDGSIYERLRTIECQKVSDEKAKKDQEKAAAALKAAAAATAAKTP